MQNMTEKSNLHNPKADVCSEIAGFCISFWNYTFIQQAAAMNGAALKSSFYSIFFTWQTKTEECVDSNSTLHLPVLNHTRYSKWEANVTCHCRILFTQYTLEMAFIRLVQFVIILLEWCTYLRTVVLTML